MMKNTIEQAKSWRGGNLDKKAIRDAYGEALKELGEKNQKVVALEADVGGSTKSKLFGEAFKDRYFNVGISELNMVNMSAGMAREGLIPFVNTFSAFLSTRGADPIQSLIGYDRLNVKLAGTYVGLSDSYDGASHHAISDVSFIRSIPGFVIITPSDPVMTKKAVFAAASYDGPVYLRLSRAEAPVLYDNTLDFEIGRGIKYKNGRDVTIVSTGTLLSKAIDAAKQLETEGIDAEIIDIHTLKPFDEQIILDSAEKTRAVVTVEENSLYGGLFSAVCETLSMGKPTFVAGIGATSYAESGDYEGLLKKYGYSADNIAQKARDVLKKRGE